MALVESLSCSLQTRNTKFLIAPRLNQVSMSMCLKSPCTRDKSTETCNNKPVCLLVLLVSYMYFSLRKVDSSQYRYCRVAEVEFL